MADAAAVDPEFDNQSDEDSGRAALRSREAEQRRLEEELERLLQAQDNEHDAAGPHDPLHHPHPHPDNPIDQVLQQGVDPNAEGGENPQLEPLQQPLGAPPPPPPNQFFAAPWKDLTYVQSSFYVAYAVFYYAFRSRQQFYLTMVFLSSSKISLAVFGNALIAFSIWCFDQITGIFLNGLRLQEAEGLQDFFRWNVTETCLALTMFRSELSIQTAVEFLFLIWIKCVHQVALLRENHIRMTQEAVEPLKIPNLGSIPVIPWTHIKLWMLLLLLQVMDLWVVQYTSLSLLKDGPSVNILFMFETAILLVSAWSHLLLLYLHAVDGWLHYGHEQHFPLISKLLHPWKEYKATLVFAVELQAQAIQFFFYLTFFGIVLTYYGMPLNLFREVYMSFASLKERLGAFLKYRRLMANMSRFQNATEEQLEESGRVCIICRDEMTTHDSKQLPVCCHLFHKSCLREWLVQQQSCPTCRSDIAAMSAQEAARTAAAQAAEQRGQAPNQPAEETPPPTDQVNEGAEQPPVAVSEAQQRRGRAVSREVPSSHQQNVRPVSERSSHSLNVRKNVDPLAPQVAAPPTWHFPALYRVVREEGSAVWLDDHVVRVIPQGTVVLCQEISVDERGILFLKIPDGWVPEDDVLHIKDIQRNAPASTPTTSTL